METKVILTQISQISRLKNLLGIPLDWETSFHSCKQERYSQSCCLVCGFFKHTCSVLQSLSMLDLNLLMQSSAMLRWTTCYKTERIKKKKKGKKSQAAVA